MAKHTIEVIGIKTYSYHGCLPEETKIGGNYEVDVYLTTDFQEAAIHDDLSKTIDYVQVNQIVKEEMDLPSKLIEAVGHRIMERFRKEVKNLFSAKLKIKKFCPPINGEVNYVAITIEENFG